MNPKENQIPHIPVIPTGYVIFSISCDEAVEVKVCIGMMLLCCYPLSLVECQFESDK